MTTLNGHWSYQSFCAHQGTTELAAPWSPPGELEVSTDASGKITGTLKFPIAGVELLVTGTITPAAGRLPEGVELMGEGMGSVNQLRGYWITAPAGAVIVGTVKCLKNDLAKQPDGTSGPFLLFPATR